MTDDFDQDDDMDMGFGEESFDDNFDQDAGESLSLKEVWQTNPLLKIAAAVVVVTIVVGGLMTFFKTDPAEETKSMMRSMKLKDVKTDVKSGDVSEAYLEAIEEENIKTAEQAARSGESAIPRMIDQGQQGEGLSIPEIEASDSDKDPLEQWRSTVKKAQTMNLEDAAEDDILAPEPDLVPLVQPVRPKVTLKMDPKAAQALASQMRTIIAAQAPTTASLVGVTGVEAPYLKQKREEEEAEKRRRAEEEALQSQQQISGRSANNVSRDTVSSGGTIDPVQAVPDRVIVPAGQIAYAQLLTELNTDVPGPALARMLSGPFQGGRVMGQMQQQEDLIVITFSKIIKDDVIYAINGIALDEATTLPATRTDIDRHYFSRIVLPAAASFVEGFAAAVAETETSTTTDEGTTTADTREKSAKEELFAGIEEAATTATEVLLEDAPDGPTIIVARGTTMGVLFLDSVTTSSAN